MLLHYLREQSCCMIKAVIFDLDGVIIDSEPVHFMLEKQMFEELKIAVPFEEHNSYVGMSSENMWETIVNKHNLIYSAKNLVQKKHELYLKHLLGEENVYPIRGVAELIKDLYKNNFILTVASSSPLEVIDAVLKKFDLSKYFIATVSGTELIHSKPHPEIFLRAAEFANCEPRECIVIEDSENGVTAAKAAGMKCIGFLNPNSGVQNLNNADVIIKSFEELNVDFIRSF
jgi:HAD superfamily hydrolase (TIGR01509 family)